MLETIRYELFRKRRETAVLVGGVSVLAGFFVALFPGFRGTDVDIDDLIQAWPPALREAFGIETIATIEGFLAVELYNFVWLLVLGIYVAYSAAGVIADAIERERMDLLLSFPLSRTRLLAEKFVPLLLVVVVLNAVVAAVVYAAVVAIGESIDPVSLLAVHGLSIPYLFACGALGLVLSTALGRAGIAQRVAIALVFLLYLLESVAATVAPLQWLQYLSPTHYYNPTPILVGGSYALVDASVLLAAFAVLVVCSGVVFRRRDI